MDYYSTDIKKIKSFLMLNIADTYSTKSTSAIGLKMDALWCFAFKMQGLKRKTVDNLNLNCEKNVMSMNTKLVISR
jgi:hypothetical protein